MLKDKKWILGMILGILVLLVLISLTGYYLLKDECSYKDKDVCYSSKSLEKNNLELCFEIENELKKNNCIYNYVVYNINNDLIDKKECIEICGMINESLYTKEMINNCNKLCEKR